MTAFRADRVETSPQGFEIDLFARYHGDKVAPNQGEDKANPKRFPLSNRAAITSLCMADETTDDQLPIEVEAAFELDPKPPLKRGMASLRGVKRTTYMRRSILRMLSMAPEERATYNPRNGFEEISKAMLDAPKKGKEGAVVVAVFREIKECLGERIGSRWKDTQEHNSDKPSIILDIPSVKREKELEN